MRLVVVLASVAMVACGGSVSGPNLAGMAKDGSAADAVVVDAGADGPTDAEAPDVDAHPETADEAPADVAEDAYVDACPTSVDGDWPDARALDAWALDASDAGAKDAGSDRQEADAVGAPEAGSEEMCGGSVCAQGEVCGIVVIANLQACCSNADFTSGRCTAITCAGRGGACYTVESTTDNPTGCCSMSCSFGACN